MKIAENFTKNTGSAVTATILLTILAITAIVLPIMTLVGRYSGALKEFMKTGQTIAGRSAGQNWMYVAGAGLVIFVAGGVAAGLSFRRKPEPTSTQTKPDPLTPPPGAAQPVIAVDTSAQNPAQPAADPATASLQLPVEPPAQPELPLQASDSLPNVSPSNLEQAEADQPAPRKLPDGWGEF